MKTILVLYFSQSGQLEEIMLNLIAPLLQDKTIKCDLRPVKPLSPYPYPWPLYTFFDSFPEAVGLDGCPVEKLTDLQDYDLIILGYTVWFLSPSIPITGFLKSPQARALFKNKPVVTVIACRDMWLIAQEKMKTMLDKLEARLLDNVVLTDQGKSLSTFLTTPRWLLTGKKDAFWGLPAAGVSPDEIRAASRFGERLREALAQNREKLGQPLLRNLGAVNVNGKLIASERIAERSFLIWGKILKKAG
ncbi:MAG: dialkylresorcinol condensing enzyme, partial [Deltaproteobacteria bacterium]|nr:dialkylresorcinol condensing enzyme [Deltaproteobacteria bacterium]